MDNSFLYVYTKTKNVDYRNLFAVSSDECPDDVQKMFLKRIRAILNKTDDFNLSVPVFLYIRQDKYVLYGIACLNKVLSADYSVDRTRSTIRGFFGVLTTVSLIKQNGVVYSTDFYKYLYERYIIPEWDIYSSVCTENQQLCDNSIFAHDRIYPTTPVVVNKEIAICRLFSASNNGVSLLSEAMGVEDDISIALNVDSEEQVSSPAYYPLTNALLKENRNAQYEDIEVKRRCCNCGRDFDELYCDDICADCWRILHNTSSNSLETIDCGSGVEDDKEGNEETRPIFCFKCGQKIDILYTHEKLCDKCYVVYAKRQKLKKRFFLIAGFIMVILLIICCLRFFLSAKYNTLRSTADSILFSKETMSIHTKNNQLNDVLDNIN